jgi:hypothetical protein
MLDAVKMIGLQFFRNLVVLVGALPELVFTALSAE